MVAVKPAFAPIYFALRERKKEVDIYDGTIRSPLLRVKPQST